ncbi:hydroxymethylpyrimidine/phosphomethylpyrimidine kinase [Fulvivirgaceae bacterium BMA10]|uniref:hydroxymethylpyrimidine kinase n=1 Tax=Splendidivirga corallicola TaxID=3051826 RepID=A0ABT8KPJ5_9BACT|nr:hydroxymethylpyrimidine/phosphomethylpyrimidine kinase [Fulvivirgaceae bacterium BMA10]
MPGDRPKALSIAGYDPSGGAGLLADIKTFEANKVLGMGVCTALTIQNESELSHVDWVEVESIKKQISMLYKKHRFRFVKIGIVENWEVLDELLVFLQKNIDNVKVIWDPILKASAGYQFIQSPQSDTLIKLLKKIYLLTPNWEEAQILSGKVAFSGAESFGEYCHVFLKGGHNPEALGKDHLFMENDVYPFKSKKLAGTSKHGSGCVLSSAITANLARGYNLQRSCLRAKDYITRFLNSNNSLLGYHKI